MNKSEKEVIDYQLDSEKQTIKELRAVYKKASQDLKENIERLVIRYDETELQSIIYQKNYQEAIKKQIDDGLKLLITKEYDTIDDFLNDSYKNGYIGNIKLLHNQGIPLVLPIDMDEVTKALKIDTRLSKRYYKANPLKGRLEENYDLLKTRVRTNISRGIIQGQSWQQIAVNIASGMNSPMRKALNDSIRIVRTEGHRIHQQGFLDAGFKAKNKGADVIKQWDATLDGRTRDEHRLADGQTREWDEDFEVGGEKMKAPSIGGSAKNVINCRCCLLQRAKWALDDEELERLKKKADYFKLDKSESFDNFKTIYLKTTTTSVGDILNNPIISQDTHYTSLINGLTSRNITYNPVKEHQQIINNDEIIYRLAGGDNTKGSCASLGLAYIGQRQGWDVLDFRGGDSQKFFSQGLNLYMVSQLNGVKVIKSKMKGTITAGVDMLKQCEKGKEYYLCVGRHASIVRRTDNDVLQYLELQSATSSGWTDFNGNVRYTLKTRFGCPTNGHSGISDFMIDITDSDFSKNEFKSLLGYINTDESRQVKGTNGTIK
ncbi:MAG: phage minor head protein [Eubacterium sp.]|nr:phage minor head protein [Eubacterium sp.]